jgi:hypothetical protein
MRHAGSYLNCPRCGLSIGIRSPWLAITHCPRCIARHRVAVLLFSSELPASVLYATGSLPSADTIAAPLTSPASASRLGMSLTPW